MSTHAAVDHRLTAEQVAAVTRPADSRTLIIAPAGTGKTHTLVHRLDHLLDGDLSADEVLLLSFSRAAVRELANRAASSTGRGRFVAARTFDAWALELLTRTYPDTEWHVMAFDERIRWATDALRDGHAEEFTASIRHVLLDEVQDLVGGRRQLVEALLTTLSCDFTLVGDPAQAVYGFQARGYADEADVFSWVRHTYRSELVELALTLDFRARTPRPAGLLACGAALRAPQAASREAVPRMTRNEFLDVPTAGELDDIVSGFAHIDGSCAILCGDNGQALDVSAVLHGAGVAHRLQHRAGEEGSPRWLAALFRRPGLHVDRAGFAEQTGLTEAAAVAAWEVLSSVAGKGVDRVDLLRLRAALAAGRLSGLDVGATSSGLIVSSMHRAKGLEFDRVFLIERERPDDDLMEKARLLYMAMTRCRDDMFRLALRRGPGGTYIKRADDMNRWGRYHFQKRGARLGMSLESGDVSRDFPASAVQTAAVGAGADAADVQDYLATEVQPGDPVTLARIDPPPDDPTTPGYVVQHRGRPVGVMSQSFREALTRYVYGRRKAPAAASWPTSITDCWIEDVEAVAGSAAAGRRAGLGDHGVWLSPRLTGLSWFHYTKAVGDRD